MIELLCFIIGVIVGMLGSFGVVVFFGKKEISKRSKRSSDWQKRKKTIDKEIMDEYGV